MKQAWSRVKTSPSTIVGLTVNTIDWRGSPPIFCAHTWPSLLQWWRPIGPSGQGGDRDDSDRVRGCYRPGQERRRHQPASSWRQHHGCERVYDRDGAETAGVAA